VLAGQEYSAFAVHFSAPAADHEFAGHGLQVAAPTALYVFAGQVTHAATLPLP
jgi:hypothetical protein